MRYFSRAEELQKCCQNCSRCASHTVVGASAYYCSAYRRYVDPSGSCPLYSPNNGYSTTIEEEEE